MVPTGVTIPVPPDSVEQTRRLYEAGLLARVFPEREDCRYAPGSGPPDDIRAWIARGKGDEAIIVGVYHRFTFARSSRVDPTSDNFRFGPSLTEEQHALVHELAGRYDPDLLQQ